MTGRRGRPPLGGRRISGVVPDSDIAALDEWAAELAAAGRVGDRSEAMRAAIRAGVTSWRRRRRAAG